MASDKERLDAAADWIRNNRDKLNTPDGVKITNAYKQLRGSLAEPAPAPDPARVAADANAKKEWEQGGFGYDLVDAGRQAFKGIPIAGGLMDEGLASLSSALGGDYDKSLEYHRARDRFREELNPDTSVALNLTGGIGGTLLAAPAVGLSSLGVGTARPLLQRAAGGALIGAPLGAGDAFTRGEEGLENRAGSAAVGGLLGTVAGAAAPVIGQGISSAYQTIANRLSQSASLSRLGLTRPVAEEIFDRFSPDELGGRGAARIRTGGDNAMIADAGPNALGMLDATIQKGGPGAALATRAVEQRATAANQRLRGSLDQTLGAPEGVTARTTAIRDATRPVVHPLYEQAYATPIDYTSRGGNIIAGLWRRVQPAQRQQANRLLHEGGFDPIRPGQLPTVRQLDYVTRALNNVAESAEGQGALGGINEVGRSAQSLSMQLRNALRSTVPAYGRALDTFADAAGRSRAVKLGARVLDKNFTRADLAEELDGITGPERQHVLGGLRDQIDEIAANVRGMASDPNVDARQLNELVRSLTTEANRQKITMALGNPNAAMRFFREVGQAARAAELRAGVSQNSRTATRTETIRGMDERLRPGIVGTAMEGDIPGATKKAIAVATGSTPRQSRLRNNEQWRELAAALTTRRGRTAELFLRQLQQAANARAANSAVGQNLGIAGAGAVAGSQPVGQDALLRTLRTRPYPEAPQGYPYTVAR